MIPELMHVGAFLCNFLMNVFVKPDEQSKFTCSLPWRENVHKMNESFIFVQDRSKVLWKYVQATSGSTTIDPNAVRPNDL